MKKIEASKLNRSLKEVLDAVSKGSKVELTRYGKVVAKIVPPGAKEPKVDATTDEGRAEIDQRLDETFAALTEEDEKPKVEITKASTDLSADEKRRQRQRDFLLGRINRSK